MILFYVLTGWLAPAANEPGAGHSPKPRCWR